jgi:hypothetical protein
MQWIAWGRWLATARTYACVWKQVSRLDMQ